MSSLAGLLGTVVTMLQGSRLCSGVRVVETQQFSDRQFAFKVRAELDHGGWLQVRLYVNGDHIDYAYHLATAGKVVRWDNKEHFAAVSTHPHHFHTASGRVEASPLRGNPEHDLQVVLRSILEE